MSTNQPSTDSRLRHRLTIRIDEARLAKLEALVEDGQHPNQAEAVRTAIDELVGDD